MCAITTLVPELHGLVHVSYCGDVPCLFAVLLFVVLLSLPCLSCRLLYLCLANPQLTSSMQHPALRIHQHRLGAELQALLHITSHFFVIVL